MDSKSRYTLRTDQVLLEKLGSLVEYEGRTKNRELEQMIKRRIAAFEQEHGEIPIYMCRNPPRRILGTADCS